MVMNRKIGNIEEKGQTIIETALMMILLLMFFFGIAEIARAWWAKNALNNAARVGVRVAIVSVGISNETRTRPGNWAFDDCEKKTGNDKVFCAIWNARIPLPAPSATLDVEGVNPGNTVKVTLNGDMEPVVPNLWRWIPGLSGSATLLPGLNSSGKFPMTSSSWMRHE
jgi:Flp pilus assembly protein TadG